MCVQTAFGPTLLQFLISMKQAPFFASGLYTLEVISSLNTKDSLSDMDLTTDEELNVLPTNQEHISPNSHMIYLMYRQLSDFLWNEEFWLPLGYKWKDLEHSEENLFPNFWDLWIYPFIIAVCFIIIHHFTTHMIFLPLADYLGIKCSRKRPPAENKLLEELLREYNTSRLTTKEGNQIAQRLGWKRREVERWIRHKRASSKLSTGEKFSLSCFQFMFHNCYNIFGIVILWNKEWLWDITLCYKDYPNFIVTDDIWWYYMIGLGAVWASVIREALCFSDRNGTAIDFVHHAFTISLMVLSWSINLIRGGTLVLLVHHWNDGFILGTKMALYANMEKLANFMFVALLISWFITRIIIYPFWIIHSTLFEAPKIGFMPAAYIFYGCLLGIGALNIIWFGMMLMSAHSRLTTGKIKDVRSSLDDSSEGEQYKKKK